MLCVYMDSIWIHWKGEHIYFKNDKFRILEVSEWVGYQIFLSLFLDLQYKGIIFISLKEYFLNKDRIIRF